MSSEALIQDHAKWRQGVGGAKAGVEGISNASSYTGLDLGLIAIADTTFTGSAFTQINFELARISGSRFSGCRFTDCEFSQARISASQIRTRSFTRRKSLRSSLSSTLFSQCVLDDVVFEQGNWQDIKLADCQSDKVECQAAHRQGREFSGHVVQNRRLR